MADYPIASDLSYLVLQRRRRMRELDAPQLDSSNQLLYALPSVAAGREAFVADRAPIADSFQGESRWPRQRDVVRG